MFNCQVRVLRASVSISISRKSYTEKSSGCVQKEDLDLCEPLVVLNLREIQRISTDELKNTKNGIVQWSLLKFWNKKRAFTKLQPQAWKKQLQAVQAAPHQHCADEINLTFFASTDGCEESGSSCYNLDFLHNLCYCTISQSSSENW